MSGTKTWQVKTLETLQVFCYKINKKSIHEAVLSLAEIKVGTVKLGKNLNTLSIFYKQRL